MFHHWLELHATSFRSRTINIDGKLYTKYECLIKDDDGKIYGVNITTPDFRNVSCFEFKGNGSKINNFVIQCVNEFVFEYVGYVNNSS